jgi:hypothetical protein
MTIIQAGDTVLVNTPGELENRKIGKVVEELTFVTYKSFAARILVTFEPAANYRYKSYYTPEELTVITIKDNPEYFI